MISVLGVFKINCEAVNFYQCLTIENAGFRPSNCPSRFLFQREVY